jgi:hypothetical protein
MSGAVDVYLADAEWHRVFDALMAGEFVRGFALTVDLDGYYAVGYYVADLDSAFPIPSPSDAPRIHSTRKN